jgi:hypothetical protein
VGLAVVRDLREMRGAASPEEIEQFEIDVFGGFVLARSAAGLSDSTIRSDVSHLEQVRTWFGRPLWDMEPADADAYFGTVLRAVPPNTRLARAQAIKTYFEFVELRHKVEIHNLTGRVLECPIDEMNRPRSRRAARLRIPPTAEQVGQLFGGWRGELATCRKFGPTARSYAASRLMSEVGLPVNEARYLDLADIRWELGRFGKLHVRHGKGARGSGPRERMVPLINDAGRTLRWFVEDVWGQLGDDPARHGVPLFCSRAQECRRHRGRGGQRGVAGRAGRGRRPASVGVAGNADTACPAALLREPALFRRDGFDRHSGDTRTRLDSHNDELRSRSSHACRGRLDRWSGPCRRTAEGALGYEVESASGRREPGHLEGQ